MKRGVKAPAPGESPSLSLPASPPHAERNHRQIAACCLLLLRHVFLALVFRDVVAPWIGSDRAWRLPHNLELAVSLHFADEHWLVQVMVFLVHCRGEATWSLEGLTCHGGDHLVGVG